MRIRPLPGLCAAFAAGILLSAGWLPVVWCLAICSAALVVFGLARGRSAVAWAGAFTLMAWFGAASFSYRQTIPDRDVSRLPSTSLTLTGTIDDDVAVEDDSRTDEPAAAKFVLDVSSARLDSDSGSTAGNPIAGRVSVRLALVSKVTQLSLPEPELPHIGDLVELRGRLEPPDGPRNPGGFDYRAYLARRGIYASLAVDQPERMHLLKRASWANPLLMLASTLRRGVLNACKHALPRPDSGMLAGILIGERHAIPQPIQEEFERTGVTHILATAGLHVGMVVWLLTAALRNTGVPRKPARIAAIIALILYAVMAGERAAVVRAVIVACVYLFGELLEREPDLSNGLAIAALALLVANPNDLFDPGFQLSFATVITIVLLMPIFQRLVEKIDKRLLGESVSMRVQRFTAKGIATVALLSVAAQLGAAPFIACYFYNVSTISIVANTLAVPAVFAVIALGFPMAILFAIHPWLAAPVAFLLHWLVGYILGTVHLFSDAPFASCNVSPPAPLQIAGYYACLWSIAWYVRGAQPPGKRAPESRQRGAIRKIALVSGILVLALGVWGVAAPRPREMRVTFLDVGQGDACVLETPSGSVLVVDTGGQIRDGEDDQGRRVVAPYLRYRGINAIAAIILSHPHADHIGGAQSLIGRFPTGAVMDDGLDEEKPLVRNVSEQAAHSGSQLRVARRGQTLDFGDGVTVEVVAPADVQPGIGANNASVVVRVKYGRTSFLFTGDAETPEELEMLKSGADISCDVLKVGHHGSKTSSSPALLAAARPKFAVISVGKRNLYNHPSPEIVERILATGAKVYRTDKDGAVTCRSDGVSVRFEKMVR